MYGDIVYTPTAHTNFRLMFKAKLRKIGNSLGVIIPHKVITNYKEGDEIELDVITKGQKEGSEKESFTPNVITKQGENKKLTFNINKGVYE